MHLYYCPEKAASMIVDVNKYSNTFVMRYNDTEN